MNITAGVIGYRNHSLKIIKLLLKNKNIKEIVIFCYKKKNIKNLESNKKEKKIIYTHKLEDLTKASFFFITSPTSTHLKYIKKLISSNKPIFCEKPGFASLSEYNYLRKLSYSSKKKIFINYNLIHSKLFYLINRELIKNSKDRLINISVYSLIGIAFIKKFKQNWRFTSKNILERISGNLGVHYVNFCINLFGNINKILFHEFAIANKKKIDTCNINLNFANKASANIFLSYAGPMTDRMEFYFSNKILIYEDNKLYKVGPRNVFDKMGLFTRPSRKLIYKFKKDLSQDSLESSVNFFIKEAINNKNFKEIYFDYAINTGRLFLKNNF